MSLLNKLFGTYSERELKRLRSTVATIMDLESTYKNLSEEALKHKTVEFRQRLQQGASLDSLLPKLCDS